MNKVAIIFGGSGFVGSHLINHILREDKNCRIINVDIKKPRKDNASVQYIVADIRESIDVGPFQKAVQGGDVVIYNLAAICRIPGFPYKDYFEVNVTGAETVCEFASTIGCDKIVFISSVAVYGTSEMEKTEDVLPLPDNPYGISKAIAEKIHLVWYAEKPGRDLHILRPGIIFGKNENANFTRLYKGQAGKYFVYPGRKNTLKAAVYVKDVAACSYYFAEKEKELSLFNLVYPEARSIKHICETISKVTGVGKPWIVMPIWPLVIVAHLLQAFMSIFGRSDISLHPDRIKKLTISTNVTGGKLLKHGFKMKYSLREAIEDWYEDSDRRGLL